MTKSRFNGYATFIDVTTLFSPDKASPSKTLPNPSSFIHALWLIYFKKRFFVFFVVVFLLILWHLPKKRKKKEKQRTQRNSV